MDDSIVKKNEEIEKLLTRYFQREYDLDSTFMFSHIRYKCKYFGTRRILDLNNGGKIKEIQEDILEEAIAHVPILVPHSKDWDYGRFMSLNNGMKIDDIIDLDSGNEETIRRVFLNKIKQIMPEGTTIIDEEELDSALKNLGYTTYKFDFENLGSLGDGRIATRFTGTKESAIHDISEIQTIIPDRRQGQVFEVLSRFMNEYEKDQKHDDLTKE